MTPIAVDLIAGSAVLVIGALVLGWKTWPPALRYAELEREREDNAREFFDANGRWPDQRN